MFDLIVTPKVFALIVLASVGKDVSAFVVQIPEHLLMEAQKRAVNFAIQYGALTIGQSVVGSAFVDPGASKQLFAKGIGSLASASSIQEAASRGSVAAAVLILSSLSSEDPNVSLTLGEFLFILSQNVLFPGSHCIHPIGIVQIYSITNILIQVVTEIRIERNASGGGRRLI